MGAILQKLTAFFTALLMLVGAYSLKLEVKTSMPIEALELTGINVTNGYTVSVPENSGNITFNRISFNYKSTAALRAVFTYRQGLKTLQEELLLSTKNKTASMLLDGYLKRRCASGLISVYFEPVAAGQRCVVNVSDFKCDIQTVPKGDVLYIENGRFKAGIKLNWGGGLCYFEDKNDKKYGNLLNCHDTGRLVQQSYYGPMDIEGYENGIYGDSRWNYNPVQGGDMYGNTSKLVALEATGDSIRVVCRPLDWAQNNMPTLTYYTNVFKLTEKGLTVENTAVDFLQTKWVKRAQEIPAFYTVSALGNFVYYNGTKPWTNAPLTVKKDLDFWGGKPAFDLDEKNTETWCAWTDDAGYGVGLFTPIAESLLAGRFMYNGTADANDNPTNYVAPLGFFVLRYNIPFTYVYHLTAGNVSEIRNTFRTLR